MYNICFCCNFQKWMELGGWKYIANIVTLTFLRFWVRKCYKNQEKQSFSCSLVPWLHLRRNRAVYIYWGIVRSGNQSSWLVPVHRCVIDCKQVRWSIGASIWKKSQLFPTLIGRSALEIDTKIPLFLKMTVYQVPWFYRMLYTVIH